MKNLLQKSVLNIIGIIGISIVFLLVNCGGETRREIISNEYLGKVPGIALNYVEENYVLEEELEKCTDRDKCFTLQKEIEILKQEAEDAIDEYLANNPITNLPFEQEADYRFIVENVWVDWASTYRIGFKAKVTITEDIKNQWGNFERHFFAYIKAVDKEGNLISSGYGVMMNCKHGPLKPIWNLKLVVHLMIRQS